MRSLSCKFNSGILILISDIAFTSMWCCTTCIPKYFMVRIFHFIGMDTSNSIIANYLRETLSTLGQKAIQRMAVCIAVPAETFMGDKDSLMTILLKRKPPSLFTQQSCEWYWSTDGKVVIAALFVVSNRCYTAA